MLRHAGEQGSGPGLILKRDLDRAQFDVCGAIAHRLAAGTGEQLMNVANAEYGNADVEAGTQSLRRSFAPGIARRDHGMRSADHDSGQAAMIGIAVVHARIEQAQGYAAAKAVGDSATEITDFVPACGKGVARLNNEKRPTQRCLLCMLPEKT